MKEAIKDIFVEGAITPEKIAKSIRAHQSKTGIGAHDLFLGQVRADEKNGKKVQAIEFTAQRDMANQICHEIKEATFIKYPIHCMHIYHSIGTVNIGELCIFVFMSATNRSTVFDALQEVVNEIKANVPIFGKELYEDQSHSWKKNN